ncbi:hypothetical protein [Xylophilus ampelinus]|uniref:hypothetical protein n=1 Tax=Xylophilus ampelinus TaxID=54067 RepID=UPI0011B62B33|nr:hypothetical protein [Xylophilus ampelinus]MCS4509701.1 hypothetical protein [Xylophilus ampelinus]
MGVQASGRRTESRLRGRTEAGRVAWRARLALLVPACLGGRRVGDVLLRTSSHSARLEPARRNIPLVKFGGLKIPETAPRRGGVPQRMAVGVREQRARDAWK